MKDQAKIIRWNWTTNERLARLTYNTWASARQLSEADEFRCNGNYRSSVSGGQSYTWHLFTATIDGDSVTYKIATHAMKGFFKRAAIHLRSDTTKQSRMRVERPRAALSTTPGLARPQYSVLEGVVAQAKIGFQTKVLLKLRHSEKRDGSVAQIGE